MARFSLPFLLVSIYGQWSNFVEAIVDRELSESNSTEAHSATQEAPSSLASYFIGTCDEDAVRFVEDNLDAFRIESYVGSAAFTVLTATVAFTGSIPSPNPGSRWAIAMWLLWMLFAALQLFIAVGAFVAYCMSFEALSEQHHDCLVDSGLAGGQKLFNIFVFFVAPFHPKVILCLVQFVINFAMIVFAMRLRWILVFKEDLSQQTIYMFAVVISSMFILLTLFSFVITFVGSMSVLFSLAFVPTMLAVTFFVGLLGTTAAKLNDNTKNSKSFLGKLTREATMWLNDGCILLFVSVSAAACFCLSPLVVQGTMLALHCYAGHSVAENNKLIVELYKATWDAFTSLDFHFTVIDLTSFQSVLLALEAQLSGWPSLSWGPSALSNHSGSLLTANFLVGLLKGLSNSNTFLLARFGLGPKNSAASKLAIDLNFKVDTILDHLAGSTQVTSK